MIVLAKTLRVGGSAKRNHRLGLSADDMLIPSSLSTRDCSTSLVSSSSWSFQQRRNVPFQHHVNNVTSAIMLNGNNNNRDLDILLPGSTLQNLGGGIMNYAMKIEHMRDEFALEILRRKRLEKQLAEKEDLLKRARQDVVDSCAIINRKEHEMAQLENKLKKELDRKKQLRGEMGNILQHFQQVQKEYLSPEGILHIQGGEKFINENENNYGMLMLEQNRNTEEEVVSTLSAPVVPAQQQQVVVSTVELNRKYASRKHGLDRSQSHDEGYFCRCGCKLRTLHGLRSHVNRYDPSNYFFACSKCKKRFCRTNELKSHMLSKHNITLGNMYGCRTCGKVFKTVAELMEHRREKHTKRAAGKGKRSLLLKSISPKTGIINKALSTKITSKVCHVRVSSTEPDKITCSCGKVYSYRKSFNTHICRSRISRSTITKKKMSMKLPVSSGRNKGKKRVIATSSSTDPQLKHECASTQSSRDTVRCVCGIRFDSRRGLIKHVQRYKQTYRKKNSTNQKT